MTSFCQFVQKGYFWSSEGYILYETLIETCIMRSFWEVNQLRTTCGSWDIENWDFSKNWGPFSTKLALPVEKRNFFSINFNRNMYLLIILRGHWTLYEDWFTRYWIWHFCPFFHILPQKGNFRSSEGYILYQTLIETHYLRLFW